MTAAQGLVSAIIPVLNGERFLAEAIESVIAQSYQNWELLIVDDGSTDRSQEIAQSYSDHFPKKISCIQHPGHKNRGLPASRNLGASRSRGEFLAFLDCDDVWIPEKLEKNVLEMDANPAVGLLFGPSEWWYDRSPEDDRRPANHIPQLAPGDRVYDPPYLMAQTYPFGRFGSPCPSSFLGRRTAFDLVGGFVEDFNPDSHQLYEDISFLTKCYLKIPIFVSSACLSRYRCSPFSMSAQVSNSRMELVERRFFFDWIKQYLYQEGIIEPQIWRAIRKESWIYSLHLPNAATALLFRIRNKVLRSASFLRQN